MRLIVEHEDGRRLGVDDQDYDNPLGNPYNVSSRVVQDTSAEMSTRPGRPEAEHISLKAEGFQVVGSIDDEGHERALSDDEKREYS